jgi:hypothetical protein
VQRCEGAVKLGSTLLGLQAAGAQVCRAREAARGMPRGSGSRRLEAEAWLLQLREQWLGRCLELCPRRRVGRGCPWAASLGAVASSEASATREHIGVKGASTDAVGECHGNREEREGGEPSVLEACF